MAFHELHFDALTLPEDWLEELKVWVRTFGLSPDDVSPQVCITEQDGLYRLHLSVYLADEDGNRIIDQARQSAVQQPRVIDLGADPSWPEWLGTKVRVEQR